MYERLAMSVMGQHFHSSSLGRATVTLDYHWSPPRGHALLWSALQALGVALHGSVPRAWE